LACIAETAAAPERAQGCRKHTFNFEILSKELKKVDWASTNNMNSPNEIYDFIRNSIHNAMKTAKSIKNHNHCKKNKVRLCKVPWIDENVSRLCEKQNI
jgi:hypothetical protein